MCIQKIKEEIRAIGVCMIVIVENKMFNYICFNPSFAQSVPK